MAEEHETQTEIGHVLFIDIVGYSKLLIEEQQGVPRPAERDRARDSAGRSMSNLLDLQPAMELRWFLAMVRRRW